MKNMISLRYELLLKDSYRFLEKIVQKLSLLL